MRKPGEARSGKKRDWKPRPRSTFGLSPRVLTFQEAVDQGLSSSFVMTVSRSLHRLSRDCFARLDAKNFDSRYSDKYYETEASLRDAAQVNSRNSYELQIVAIKLRKAGK